MDNEKCQEFVKSFKVALTNCSVYFPKHPIFSQSVDNFQTKLLQIIGEGFSLTIKVKPDSLIIAEQLLEKDNISQELAAWLHRKKIKSITIAKEAAKEELSEFLAELSGSDSDILSKGGLKKILKDKRIENIDIDELDYSHLLKGKGAQVKDVWKYLFSSEKSSESRREDSQFLDNFEKTVDEFGIKEVLEDEQLSKQLMGFFSRLQVKTEKDLKNILKKVGASILETKGIDKVQNKEKLKELFLRLSPEDLADLLANLFKSDVAFEQSSFELFSFLIPPDSHKKTAQILEKQIKQNKEGLDIERVKNVLSPLKEEGIVPIYRKYLLGSVTEGVFEGKVKFDLKHLKKNYRLSLLDMFFYETHLPRLNPILDKISEELKDVFYNDWDYFSKFIEVYKQKAGCLKGFEYQVEIKKIWSQAERIVFDLPNPDQLIILLNELESSTLDLSFYLDKFKKGKFNVLACRLFFKFFPQELNRFQEIIVDRKSDFRYLDKILTCLEKVDHPVILELFKKIYDLVPDLKKIEILDKLKNYSRYDEGFVAELAKSRVFTLRKKSAEIACNFVQLQEIVAENLLSLSNFLGFNSKLILENLEILADLPNPAAKPFLDKLSGYKFFWNKQIRRKASELLKEYDEKKD